MSSITKAINHAVTKVKRVVPKLLPVQQVLEFQFLLLREMHGRGHGDGTWIHQIYSEGCCVNIPASAVDKMSQAPVNRISIEAT
ncbi:hypothetical protein M3J09_006094 [Ascochyta lentis]